jgi:hypothetical protein
MKTKRPIRFIMTRDPELPTRIGFEVATEADEQESRFAGLLKMAGAVTVINDGQVQYPVLTAYMDAWVAANGEITDDNYGRFCGDVKNIGEVHALAGGGEMIGLCNALTESGAATVRLG